MPENCNLLARTRQEPNFGANLEHLKSYASTTPKYLDYRADDLGFVDFACELHWALKLYPELKSRNLFLGRRWDMLYYLLSARRRRSEARDWSHWVEIALFGGEILNKETQTTIGFPIRYLNPAGVSEINRNLETITAAMLCAHWNPRKMSEAGVYKIHADEDRACLKWVEEDFEKIKAFYTSIEERDEGVLTFVS